MSDDRRRELGRIEKIFDGPEDHGIDTVSIGVDFGSAHQAFGNLCLGKYRDSFVKELCETFGVGSIVELEGKECFALRCWGFWNDTIEGLESVETGRRFTITGWRKRNKIPGPESPLAARKESLTREILFLDRKKAQLTSELNDIRIDYEDWR